MCAEIIHFPNTHHGYMKGSHGASNAYCRGGCGFAYDSMHVREFFTAAICGLILIHQV